MTFALMMLGGMLIDVALGWPDRVYARIGHPVTWLGRAITWLERGLNTGGRNRRLAAGALTCLCITGLAALPAWLVQQALPPGWVQIVIGALCAWPLIAVRAMYDHVQAVATPLAQGDLPAARYAVSMIVGRDPSQLDAAGIARAATESLAENTSDGIIAPLFWGVIAGLPGIAAYKAINTLDSMIGHRNDRYDAFGKVSARLDDVVNLIPARLCGVMFALVSGRFWQALRVMRRDAPKHRSPNAGWPEGAMAAGLGIRLSGPRVYDTHIAQEPWLNETARDPEARDLAKGLVLYRRAMALAGLVLFGLALL